VPKYSRYWYFVWVTEKHFAWDDGGKCDRDGFKEKTDVELKPMMTKKIKLRM
jgi:hypothetical protein